MAFRKFVFVLFLGAVYGTAEDDFVKSLPQCSVQDNPCLEQVMIRKLNNPGLPTYGVLPFDPMYLNGISVNLPNLVNVTIDNAVLTGVTTCVFESFAIDSTAGTVKEEVRCNLTLKGGYTADAPNSVLAADFQTDQDLHGQGTGQISVVNLDMKIEVPLHFEKRRNETFIICSYDEGKCDFEYQGSVVFAADNLNVGDQNIASDVVSYLNENWQQSSFGQAFVNEYLKLYYAYTKRFFEGVPTRLYITDDLTPYLQN
ncbi:uncharacterized protein LOC123696641 [Colias croceus]|uniref:uncharacterized protein LOC123696641 n=2 Tax=Colias crocea TaxID=72248 RepID=UPI001E27A256|nr:uncharacterized protein LOC123696641 [Colias croceus]